MSNLRTISDFKGTLKGGGARPNLFEVSIPNFPDAAKTGPGAGWTNDDQLEFRFMCKAANMPASNVASIDVPFRGRIFKVAGDRTIDNWTVTIINDEDFSLRNRFGSWMNGIARLRNNTGATNPEKYMTNAQVMQLGRGADKGKFSSTHSNAAGGVAVKPLKKPTPLKIFSQLMFPLLIFHTILAIPSKSLPLTSQSITGIQEMVLLVFQIKLA